LIEGLLVPLYNGLPVYIMSPLDFVAHPLRWLKAVHHYRATHSSGPNFAFELCVRKTTAEQRASLDLSCWRTASCAAEPISSGTVERFLNTFESCGFRKEAFYASWGLAEATLLVTGGPGATFHRLNAAELEKDHVVYSTGEGPARTMVGCGKTLKGALDVDVQIVDPETQQPTPDGKVGEVWVRGELVAQGYWNRPEETAAIFKAQIKGDNGDRFLRTGDLGFMADGELVFTGRRKDLIIVEGRNHYPQDIEKTAEASHPALRPGCTIAFSLELDGDVQVILAAELNKEYRLVADVSEAENSGHCVTRKEIEKAVRRQVAEDHQIRIHEVVLISSNTIPKTSSGKLQRSACRQSFLSGSLIPA
jgi:acyl-CoA synthetase (AMP-forming)/AMP-acid ligase II